MLPWALLSLPIRAEPLMNNKCDTNYRTSIAGRVAISCYNPELQEPPVSVF
jgi:hypothetical protein